jgi:FdhE protein
MNAAAPLLNALKHQRPEWAPWLGVVDLALRESEEPMWAAMVPETPTALGAVPRLAGATLTPQRTVVESYLQRLLVTASKSSTREMASLRGATADNLDALSLFRAALCQERDDIAQSAVRCGVDPDAFQAVVALMPVPFLQACNRSWDTVRDWVEAFCPICGSWPAFAEVRGIEGSRYYRCGRCGSEWHAHGLSCPFCATNNHRDLVRLVPGDPAASSAIEACTKCFGYVKTFNRLQGCLPSAVLLEDLGGVALDLAAIEQGYSRPATAGYALDVTIAGPAAGQRCLTWNA